MRQSKYFLLATIFALLFMFSACQSENPVTSDSILKISALEGDVPPGQLSEEERDGLIHMRLEEKVARDVYIFLGDLYNNQKFLSIKLAEQRHMDAMAKLLTKYNVEDPVTDDTPGIFSDPVFQSLYDGFILQGQISLNEAFLVGKDIEELDIIDLEYQLTFVDNPDIIKVYTNLLAASESHLAAFVKSIISDNQIP